MDSIILQVLAYLGVGAGVVAFMKADGWNMVGTHHKWTVMIGWPICVPFILVVVLAEAFDL